MVTRDLTCLSFVYLGKKFGQPEVRIPKNEEVERVELRRQDESAGGVLQRYKKKYDDKMKYLKNKKVKVLDEQKELESNLIKFNAFVKEKQLKVQRGIQTEAEEKDLKTKMTEDIECKENMLVETKAKKRVKILEIKINIKH